MENRNPSRVLVLGASGMLGNAVFRLFSNSPDYVVFGSTRTSSHHRLFPESARGNLVEFADVENHDALVGLVSQVRPHVVVNCIGLVKQLASANDPVAAIPINSLFPHRVARLCSLAGARLVHISTDCVFDGADGNYTESSRPNAYDLYGRSKLLGEVDYDNAVTLRTSIIGRELNSAHSLIDWFLAQEGSVKGFTRAIFSGLPTLELARVIRDFVLPHAGLRGLYHVSAEAISKYDLLQLVAEIYGKRIRIERDDRLSIDRSLDSSRFRQTTGYDPPEWPALIRAMRDFG
ncbi:MAG: SDR family oxidoreductase [Mesorhizobium sp.]|uniref:dTDP-4-dehydrorhamnose reductase family protein n=1 Tax=unclassified Mesorhizobium TaxID=325217 RepID=UPI000FCC4F21|nr:MULTISPECIES: SDR family oxidoreductase [unclassified Mesorhizobium]RWF59914.1 MAG: SDR family oxidoreductase [Mesorhizobium sp.]RVC95866.1 SDR family oxidoreductase [Mesorhizobium sp. M2A.F.Ca.ET.017.03.2.1]RVD11591.1 SDR family oxidoreductase [Mesorhizobium sp. M2A.F.Ca.ET.029.05.1.1]TIW58874.1 MAG: SDR family oxidoreductase [Mesorhizobium sp.]TIW84262.1 MAG: SDR family oxidoreductase [Mesorhizobium sp.]